MEAVSLVALAARRGIGAPREMVLTGVGGEGELRGTRGQGAVAIRGLRERWEAGGGGEAGMEEVEELLRGEGAAVLEGKLARKGWMRIALAREAGHVLGEAAVSNRDSGSRAAVVIPLRGALRLLAGTVVRLAPCIS